MLIPPLPLPDAGPGDLPHALDDAFDIMDDYNRRACDTSHSRVEYCSDETLAMILAIPGRDFVVTPMWPDYVYDTRRMIDLAGGDLKGKRKARSRFLRLYPDHRTEPLSPAHRDDCLRLLNAWTAARDATHDGEVNAAHIGSDILRAMEVSACTSALDAMTDLNLTGLALYVGDRLAGFTIGEPLSPLQSLIIIEKTDPDFDGAPQFIFSEFVRLCWSHLPEVNASDDWGIPTLRFTKQSYRPARLLNKFMLARQPARFGLGFNPVEIPLQNRPFVPVPSDAPAPAGVQFRPATLADTDAILDIERRSFDSPAERFSRRQVRTLIANPRAVVSLAVLNDQPVGWAAALVRQHRRWRSGRLYAIAIAPHARGRKLGRLLAEHTFSLLARQGISRLFLEVRADNTPAINLYASLGFKPLRQLPNYYARHVHGLRMARLNPPDSRDATSPPPPPPATTQPHR